MGMIPPIPETNIQADERLLDTASPEEEAKAKAERVQRALVALVEEFDREGAEERVWLLAEVQKCLMYWHGESSLVWHEESKAWLSIWDAYDKGLVSEEDVEDYDRDINIYRPLLESIIAAASIEIPRIYFTPKKASSPVDIVTARESTKVSTYLDSINEAKELIQRAYFIIANQHFVAGYTYFESDAKKYGSEDVPEYGDIEQERFIEICPNCAADLEGVEGADPAGLYKLCPGCQQLVEPQPDSEVYIEQGITGYNNKPNSKICIEVYGDQNVKVPHWVTTQAQTPYLILDEEQPRSMLASMYSEKATDIMGKTGDADKYDRWARESIHSIGTSTKSRGTHRRIWIRDWALNGIGDEETRKDAIQMYPDGAYIVMVDDIYIKGQPQNLDDCWEISETSFSETVHDDPAGKHIMPICESQNDLLQLWMENIKHNIPESFVDSQLLDFEKYGNTMARPGMKTPVKRPPGQTISNAIHETRAVSIPRESIELYRIYETLGQFVSGALPSIFGGTIQGGTETAFEYDASRQAALQRVALRTSVVNSWWAKLKKKAVELYNANADPEQVKEYPQKHGTGFMPVTINPENLQGNIDNVVPESSSAFPTTWAQKRDFAVQALQAGNEQLMQLLFHPENSTFLKEVIGIPELFVPGEGDRMKQLWEISELLQGQPATAPNGQAISTIKPDPRTDNGPAHIITCQTWLNSDDGREQEKNNPAGYQNVIAHLTEHIMLELASKKSAGPSGAPSGSPQEGPGDVPPAEGGF